MVSSTGIFILFFAQLALSLNKIGGDSEEKINKFILFFAQLALSLDKIGGDSEEKINKFILFFAQLALSLQIKACLCST